MHDGMDCLYVLDNPSKEKHLHLEILKGLRANGFRPKVLFFFGEIDRARAREIGIPVLSLGLSKRGYSYFNPITIARLHGLIRREKAVLVHCQRYRTFVNAALAMRGTQAKSLLYTVRSTGTLRHFHRRVIFDWLSPRVDRVIAVSRAVKADVLSHTRLEPSKVVVVHNGIDVHAYNPPLGKLEARRRFNLPPDGFLYGIVARLKKAKSHKILLNAFAQCLPSLPSGYVVVAGGGPLEAELKTLAGALGIGERTIFLGHRDPREVPIVLRALDVFVHPSNREGLGMAILEAMAAGLPVITTDAEGITDIFEGAESAGIMVPVNDVSALAAAMVGIYRLSEEERASIGEAGRRRVEEAFSRDRMVRKTVEIYRSVLEAAGKP